MGGEAMHAPSALAQPDSEEAIGPPGPGQHQISEGATQEAEPQTVAQQHQGFPPAQPHVQQQYQAPPPTQPHVQREELFLHHAGMEEMLAYQEDFTPQEKLVTMRARAMESALAFAQDKDLYDYLSSPTVSTTSVVTVTAIAAKEARTVLSIDIGGGLLDADISRTGVPVHTRHYKTVTGIITKLDPSYGKFVCQDGPVALRLDRALYGTVEAASPSYEHIPGELTGCGFDANQYKWSTRRDGTGTGRTPFSETSLAGATYAAAKREHPHKAQHMSTNVLGDGVGHRTSLPVEEAGAVRDRCGYSAKGRESRDQAGKDAVRHAELTPHREDHELIHPIAVMLIIAQAYNEASGLWMGGHPTPECATTSVMSARDALLGLPEDRSAVNKGRLAIYCE
jgi:hypothetical protein